MKWRRVIPFWGTLLLIKNVWKWRKILATDQDWDYWGILNVLLFKLKNTRDFLTGPNACAVHSKSVLKRLDRCIKALNELVEGPEQDAMWNTFHEKYGHSVQYSKVRAEKGIYFPKEPKVTEATVEYVRGYEKITDAETFKKAEREMTRLFKREDSIKARAEKTFFEIFQADYHKWWD